MKSVCGYLRVSTDMQIELSPDSQRELIIDYCKNHDLIITHDDIYEDLGISGRTAEKRPAFNEMIAKCKSKEHPYDAIIVWKFSRFARNQEESVVYKRMLKKINVDVISISEPISDDIGGRIAESIFEIMDEYYSINLSQEVTRGMKENARRGNYQCQTPIGYKRISKGVYEVDQQQAEIVKFIFNKFHETNCVSAIARELNDKNIRTKRGGKWECKTVMYILQNPFYCGKIRWNYKDHKVSRQKINDESEWIVTQGRHEPIISEEMFNEVNEVIKSRRTRPEYVKRERAPYKHWLSGILCCSVCGAGMVYNSTKIKYAKPTFTCRNYNHGKCNTSNRVKVEKAEEVFFGFMDSINEETEILFSSIKPDSSEMDLSSYYKEELKRIEQKEKRIKQAYRDGIDTLEEYKENKAILLSEKESIQLKMANTKSEDNSNKKASIIEKAHQLSAMMKSEQFSIQEKNEALRQAIEKIVYDKASNKMRFYFYE